MQISRDDAPDSRRLGGQRGGSLGTPAAALARRLALGALLCVALVPAGAALLDAARLDWFPVGDWARIEREVRAVGGADTPLLGAPSRLGWYHPLPWFYWLLAVPYRLAGPESGLLVGSVVLNGTALVATIALVYRLAGPARAGWFAVCAAVLVGALGRAHLADPWNASLPLIPWVLVIVLAWATASGRRWALPWLAGIGALVVGTHLGYAPSVFGVTVVAAGGLWLAVRDRGGWRELRAPVLVALAVVAFLWLPAVADEFNGGPANLSQIVRFQTGGLPAPGEVNDEQISSRQALRVFSHQFTVPPPWAGDPDVDVLERSRFQRAAESPPTALVPAGALFAASLALALHRRRAPIVWMHGVAAASVGAAFVTIASIRGVPLEWLVRPAWGAGLAVWVAIGWSTLDALTAIRLRAVVPALGAVAVVAAMSLAVLSSTRPFRMPLDAESRVVAALAGSIDGAVASSDTVYVRLSPPCREPSGLALALQREGHHVVYPFDGWGRWEATVELEVVNADRLPGRSDIGSSPIVATYRPDSSEKQRLPPHCSRDVFAVIRHPSPSPFRTTRE